MCVIRSIIIDYSLFSICLLANLHPYLTVGGIRLSRGKESHSIPQDQGRGLRSCNYKARLYSAAFCPTLKVFWLNLYSLDILGSLW